MVGSVCLMTLIVVVLAVNNLKRETILLNNGLASRGQAVADFIAAGTRTSMMHGMQGALHIQSLVEQIADYPDILYIAVIDEKGRVMSHSDPSKVGGILDRDMDQIAELSQNQAWHIVYSLGPEQSVFEVVSDFAPFHSRNSRLSKDDRGFTEKQKLENGQTNSPMSPVRNFVASGNVSRKVRMFSSNRAGNGADYFTSFVVRFDERPNNTPYDWCNSFIDKNGSCSQPEYKILVGLDMREQARISRQARIHIFSLSVILLLVGFCGWFTLFIAQSYRSSQRALKNMEAFTNLLVLKLPVGIIATEKSGRIKTCNRAIARMIGKECGDSVGRYPSEILPLELAKLFDLSSSTKELHEKEMELTTKGNIRLVVHVSSLPIIDNLGNHVGKVVLVHDLTALKKLEKEVTKHDRLVALGKMAAGVAHEVRNPLSSIKGFATLLGSNFKEGSEGKNASVLLVKEVERLNRSITELLNYSRPLPLKKSKVIIQKFMENSLQLMSSDAVELGVNIKLHVAENIPELEFDRDKINQVLLNLYLNSFQAMPGGGSIMVDVGSTNDDKWLKIKITDSGSGIAKEHLACIMEPYFTTKADGTGLGLALAYKIVDEHDGFMKFESSAEKGTVAIVTLPIQLTVDG